MPEVIVIGGGAAGFFGAISCAEHGARDVLILERGPEVLGKVKISGGGRCNVTHACADPRELAENYPRGQRSLLGPFHHWSTVETIAWFGRHGVELKTEEDGRMFPVTDDSQTIIDCLTGAARDLGVEWRTRCGVKGVRVRPEGGFLVETAAREELRAESLLVATGGIRSGDARRPVEMLGHGVEPAVPSLFTFEIADPRFEGLQGLSVPEAVVRTGKLVSKGPLLLTHRGLSGPGILKLSAWGARELAAQDYTFELRIDWSCGGGEGQVAASMARQRREHGARRVTTRSPLAGIPRRLWERLCAAAGVGAATAWSGLTRDQTRALAAQLLDGRFQVRGKSLNREEFVTCGGVRLGEVNLKTMESRLAPGLYFAGEVLDIDGITGGFNFQSAWTTGRIAGEAIGRRSIRG